MQTPKRMPFTFYKQLNTMDCGPTCLRMIAKYYGVHYNANTLREKAGFTKAGVSLLGISETAEKIGFRTRGLKIVFEKLEEVTFPCILHWHQSRWQIAQVFIALVIASLIQLIFPFLTQSVVDTGINAQNLQYVIIVLVAQLMLTLSKTIVDFIRSRVLLRISNILNLQILSDFWIKLTKLPISYFDVHHTEDILQRVGDHRQIQNFLTSSAINTLFSIFNFVVYAIILVIYNVRLFLIFSIGTLIYFTWIQFF